MRNFFAIYLFYLYHPASSFVIQFVIKFIFVELVEVIRRGHSPWTHLAFLLYIGIKHYPNQFWAHNLVD